MLRRRGLGRAGRPSLVGTAARTAVVVGTASAVSGSAQRRHQEQANQAAQQQQAAAAAAEPTAPAASSTDRIGQLERLAQLRDQGVLNEAEFAAEKAKVLAAS